MGAALDAATQDLRRCGVPDPRREAEAILGCVLGTDRGGVVASRPDPLDPQAAARFQALLARRARREPFQYLTGEQEFRGLLFRVDRRVLVPRPETEDLVGAVLRALPPRAARIADLGTGSGCIVVSLCHARPDVAAFALERSADALEVARENALRHGVEGRIEFRHGDLAEPPREWLGTMDVVVSNPPYVGEAEWAALAPEVRVHEPKDALVPGPTGLEAYRSLAPAAWRLLRPGGLVYLELGYRSEAGAREAVETAGFSEVAVFPDLRGIPRILRAARAGGPCE